MIIEEVDIKNFRSHRSSKIKFEQGISVIVGDNGSGKTSILEAVNFALFKQKPNNINADDLIRRGAEEAEVSVTFYSSGRKYRVMRGRKTGKASGSALFREEKLLVRGEDEVTLEVEKILGVNGELFTSAVYIKQGEIDGLISAAPAVRKEHIGRLLGAHDLENAYKNMRELTGEYERRFEKFQAVPEDIRKTEKKISDEKSATVKLKEELNAAASKLNGKKLEVNEVENKIKYLEKFRDLLTEKEKNSSEMQYLRRDIRQIETSEKIFAETEKAHRRFTELEKEINALKEERSRMAGLKERAEHLKRELEEQEKEGKEFEEHISRALEEYSKIFEREVSSVEKLIEIHLDAMKDAEKKSQEAKRSREAVLLEIKKLETQRDEIKKAMCELEGAKNKCPTCGKALSKEHKKKLLMKYSSGIKKNQEEVSRVEILFKNIEQEKESADAWLKTLRHIDANIPLLQSRANRLLKARERMEEITTSISETAKSLKALDDLEKNVAGREKERDELREENEEHLSAKAFLRKHLPGKDELERKIEDIAVRIEEIESNIKNLTSALGYEPKLEELRHLKEEHKRLLEECVKIEKTKTEKESLISEKSRIIDSYEKELVELKEKKRESEKLADFLVLLWKIRQLFHKDYLQRELRVKSRPLVERYTREVFDRFNLPYSDIGVTEDFNLVVYSQHGEENADMLSGGERIAAALALRIGIAKALSGSAMELIMLDEPTIHLDALRRRELVDIIKKLSSIPQTIVVTHDKEFENAADRLFLVEKVEGVSQVR